MLKYTAQPEKRDVVMKNGNEVRDVLGDSQKRYRCPWAEKGKYRPRYEPIRLHDSLPGPLRKKIKQVPAMVRYILLHSCYSHPT